MRGDKAEPEQTSAGAALPARSGFVLLLAALTAVGPLSIDMYLPAMPTLATTFGASAGTVQFTLSGFFVAFAAGQLVYGPVSDALGRRRPLLVGLLLFVLASLLCTTATSASDLIFLRVLQGLGACSGVVLARAVVRDLYARDQSARVLSSIMVAMALAPLMAPLIGGHVLVLFGWQAIFVLLAAIGMVLFGLAAFGLKESLPPSRRTPLSLRRVGWAYLSLLRDRSYVGHALSSAFVTGGMFAYISGSPFVFIELHGVPPERYGLLFGLNVLGLMGGAFLNGRLVPRYGSARILRVGVASAALSGSLLGGVAIAGVGGLPALLLPLFCFIASLSFVGANAMAGALSARPELAGTGSALAGALQFGVGSLAAAAVAALDNGTAIPMTGVIAVMGLSSFTVHRLLVLRSGPPRLG